jgi:tripartite-type tricarboxylate transporter receptor subunit TctC
MMRRSLAVLALPLVRGPAAAAQGFSRRPIRLVIAFGPGTATDILGRFVAEILSGRLGQTVVVENRSGAGGTIGAAAVARSAPDGTTLLFGTSGIMSTNPAIMPDLPYDPLRDFVPIAGVANTSVVLGVRPELGVRSLTEFLALARRQDLSVGSTGTGTTGHVVQALLKLRGGVPLTHVPYRDGARAIADLLNGTLQAMAYHPLGFLPYIQSGAILPLAVAGTSRHFLLPDVPTMAEAGLPGVVVEGWWAIYAPAGISAEIVAQVNAATNAALGDPAILAELRRQGLNPMAGTPEALAAYTRHELAGQREIARAAKITVD